MANLKNLLSSAVTATKWVAIFIGSTGAALIAVEGLYRIDRERPTSLTTNEAGLIPAGEIQKAAMRKAVQPRIDRLWLTPPDQRPNIFSPPLDTFVNRGFDDIERMQRILLRTRLPPSQQWKVPNFLRHPESPSLHTITSTSQGFRANHARGHLSPTTTSTADPSRPVFRVLVLGSYPAFGHAVNDEETYSAILESEMNSQKFQDQLKAAGCQRPPRFEFINAGRQGATAIMGWSRLQAEGDELRPDLVIWDYGWIEKYLRTDQGDTGGGDAERIRRVGSTIQSLRRFCARSSVRHWELCIRLERKVTELDREASLNGWREANRRAQNWALERKTPIFLIRHDGVSIDRREYEAYHRPQQRSYFIDTTSAVRDVPATAHEVDEFWSKPNWLDEIDVTRDQVSNQAIIILRADAIQYNALGYRRIAAVVLSQLAHLSGLDGLTANSERSIDFCVTDLRQKAP